MGLSPDDPIPGSIHLQDSQQGSALGRKSWHSKTNPVSSACSRTYYVGYRMTVYDISIFWGGHYVKPMGDIIYLIAPIYRGDDQQIYTNVIFNGLLCWDSFQSFFREPNLWNHPGSYDYELRLHPSRGEPTLPAGTWLQSLAVLWSTRSVLGALHGHWCPEMSQIVQGCSGPNCLYHLSVIFDIHNIYIYYGTLTYNHIIMSSFTYEYVGLCWIKFVVQWGLCPCMNWWLVEKWYLNCVPLATDLQS